jgi:hypothetical protein
MNDRPRQGEGRSEQSPSGAIGVATKPAQILEEIDLEISGALQFATAANLQSLMRLLRMAKFEVSRLRQRPEYKDKS